MKEKKKKKQTKGEKEKEASEETEARLQAKGGTSHKVTNPTREEVLEMICHFNRSFANVKLKGKYYHDKLHKHAILLFEHITNNSSPKL